MQKNILTIILTLTVCLTGGWCQAEDSVFAPINESLMVMTCEVTDSVYAGGMVKNSYYHLFELTLDDVKMLRGTKPDSEKYKFKVITKTQTPPELPSGKVIIYIDNSGRHGIFEATPERLEIAKKAVSLPRGWGCKDGKVVSPWSESNIKWPAEAKISADIVCSKTKRPALTTPDGITWTVEQVVPDDVKPYTNPYGDGKFTVKVENTTDKKLTVPGLLCSGDKILWEACVLIKRSRSSDSKIVYMQHQIPDDVSSVELEPGQSLSHEVNVLLFPDYLSSGGRRLYYNFILADRVATNFYYYSSGHHDKLAEQYRAEKTEQEKE